MTSISFGLNRWIFLVSLGLLPFGNSATAQADFRLGLSLGFGSTNQKVEEVVGNSGGDFSKQFSNTFSFSALASMIPDTGFGWSSGFELTHQEMKSGYGDVDPNAEASLFPRNAIVQVTRYAIPLMMHYRKPIGQKVPVSMQIGTGMSLDFYEPYSGYFAYTSPYETGASRLDAVIYQEYRVPNAVSGSARLEASLGYEFSRGGRAELGGLLSLGLRKIYEGEFYLFEDAEAAYFPLKRGVDFNEIVTNEAPVDHYKYRSKGSFGVVYLRYWLPNIVFPFGAKQQIKD
ncbi:MAG: hypothetical protein ACFB10_00525 [Salibacteraceae bacterium]